MYRLFNRPCLTEFWDKFTCEILKVLQIVVISSLEYADNVQIMRAGRTDFWNWKELRPLGLPNMSHITNVGWLCLKKAGFNDSSLCV